MLRASLWLVVLCWPLLIFGEIQLPSVIGDHMVLQQEAFPALWGRARPGEQIVVIPSWDRSAPTVAYADTKGRWRIPIATPAASGPHEILIQGVENRILLRDIWVGEVWIVGGGGPLAARNKDASTPLTKFDFSPRIRVLPVGDDHASTPRFDSRGKWATLNNQLHLDSVSAVVAHLGIRLFDSLQVPIGLIELTQQDVPLHTWVRREVFEKSEAIVQPLLDFQEAQREYRAEPERPNPAESATQATTSYNAMVAPLIPFEIAGIFWGQAPADSVHPYRYARLLPNMLIDWQNQWGYRFPTYLVQEKLPKSGEAFWGLQLAGQQIFRLRGAGITSPEYYRRDPAGIAQRMADLALRSHYRRMTAPFPSPVLDKAIFMGDSSLLTFRPKEVRLSPYAGGTVPVSSIRNNGGSFSPADMAFREDTLIIYHSSGSVGLRYGLEEGQLISESGVPVLPFRTDSQITFWNRPKLRLAYERGRGQYSLSIPNDPLLPYKIGWTKDGGPAKELTQAITLKGPAKIVLKPLGNSEQEIWAIPVSLLNHPGQRGRIIKQRGKVPTQAGGINYYGMVDGITGNSPERLNRWQDSLMLALEWDERTSIKGFRLSAKWAAPVAQSQPAALELKVWGSKNGRKSKMLGTWLLQLSSHETLAKLQGEWDTDSYRTLQVEIRSNTKEMFEIDEWELLPGE